jgi:hypothetical protein
MACYSDSFNLFAYRITFEDVLETQQGAISNRTRTINMGALAAQYSVFRPVLYTSDFNAVTI